MHSNLKLVSVLPLLCDPGQSNWSPWALILSIRNKRERRKNKIKEHHIVLFHRTVWSLRRTRGSKQCQGMLSADPGGWWFSSINIIFKTPERPGWACCRWDRNEPFQVMFPMNANSCKLKIEKYFLETVVVQCLPYHFSDHKGVQTPYLRLRTPWSVFAPRAFGTLLLKPTLGHMLTEGLFLICEDVWKRNRNQVSLGNTYFILFILKINFSEQFGDHVKFEKEAEIFHILPAPTHAWSPRYQLAPSQWQTYYTWTTLMQGHPKSKVHGLP